MDTPTEHSDESSHATDTQETEVSPGPAPPDPVAQKDVDVNEASTTFNEEVTQVFQADAPVLMEVEDSDGDSLEEEPVVESSTPEKPALTMEEMETQEVNDIEETQKLDDIEETQKLDDEEEQEVDDIEKEDVEEEEGQSDEVMGEEEEPKTGEETTEVIPDKVIVEDTVDDESPVVDEEAPTLAQGQAQNGHPSEIMTRKRAASLTINEGPSPKLLRNSPSSSESEPEGVLDDDGEHDTYCWTCHKQDIQIRCRICPRSYHKKCMQHDSPDTKSEEGSCVCPECVVVMKAENVNHRSDAMQLLSMDQLSSMLKYICGRMKVTQGADAFLKPVSPEDAEDYYEYVKYPMDMAKLETNIKNRQYGSTEAFLADVQWIVHNSIIFNSVSSPYTAAAKRLLKVCRQELSEIETCPECYTNAHTKEDWFIEACKRPHILVWAKLKGFPYWPAKGMKVKDDQVDVRFFGQHDRAWVNVKDCYLYSLEQPNAAPKKSTALVAAIDELNQHIAKLKAAFGEVTLAEGKVVMDANLGVEQIQRLLPKYLPQEPSQLRGSTQVNPPKQTGSSRKSPVVLTISSLKTSPTVVSNSAVADAPAESESSSEESEEELDTNPDENAEEASSESEPPEAEPLGDIAIEVGKAEAEKEVETEEKTEVPAPAVAKQEPEHQRVPSGILASALGLRRVVKRQPDEEEPMHVPLESKTASAPVPVKKSIRRVSNASNGGKPEDEKSGDATEEIVEKEPIKIKSELQLKKQSKAQDLMDQISSQAQTKPGYRFNISKDISISAIGAEAEPAPVKSENNVAKVRKAVTGAEGVNAGGRLVRPMMGRAVANKPQQSMQVQIQQMTQVKPGAVRVDQRMAQMNKNNPGGVRLIRPVGQRTGAASSMVRPAMTIKTEQQLPVSSVATTLQMTTAQSISGAITLPGGTITVTPLTPIIAGIPVAPGTFNTTPTVNLNGAVNGLPALVPAKSGQIQQAVVRRTGTVTLPNTVATHMQQCSKGINDLLKTTIEQIAFDILDGGSMAGKVDAAVAQKEKEALVVKHAKDLADLRHSSEIAMRELRSSFENEKRRTMIETKRQCEQEKIRAVEEAKKKQWCARCQREAQFYCCWNTSYCGYHCQEKHWPQHMNICNQNKGQVAPGEDPGLGLEN